MLNPSVGSLEFMIRKAFVVGATILMFSSCGSTGSDGNSTDSGSETTVDRPGFEEDKAAAQSALLTLADFPSGWSEVPVEDETDEGANSEFAACVGSDEGLIDVGGAKASTGDFSGPDGNVTISEGVGIAQTVDEAAAQLTALEEPGVTACLQDAFRDLVSDRIKDPSTFGGTPEDYSVGEVTLGRLNVTPVGDQVVAFRVSVEIKSEEVSVNLFLDNVYARMGRSIVFLQFESALDPYAAEDVDQIVSLAVSRLPG